MSDELKTEPNLPALTQQQEVLSIIEKVALNPDADVSKMNALFDLQERVMSKQAEIDFNNAFILMKPKLPVIVKDAANSQTNSNYAKLENIKEKVDPILFENDFFYRFDEEYPDNDHIIITCYLTHKGGHTVVAKKRLAHDDVGIKGSTNKTKVHAAASTGTYGQRLSLAMALSLTFIGFDNDGNEVDTSALVDDAQFNELLKLIEEAGVSAESFCKHMAVPSIRSIRSLLYAKAVQDLKARIKKKKEKEQSDA